MRSQDLEHLITTGKTKGKMGRREEGIQTAGRRYLMDEVNTTDKIEGKMGRREEGIHTAGRRYLMDEVNTTDKTEGKMGRREEGIQTAGRRYPLDEASGAAEINFPFNPVDSTLTLYTPIVDQNATKEKYTLKTFP
ncbi:hypothetical protein PoB_005321100 [Plakobranchus ocellatus]|uniref:Uncharacterized protein n=1 Tax=Plakobranchus ocellatus TaxID=259542 RepID=A0AAV4C1R6_9GAST|nr:hypothetical protein PoB_005321100 [Plakobranchus ocellatus]